MKTKALTVFTIFYATLAMAEEPYYDTDAVKSECSKEWGTEYDMVKYCMDNRREGFEEYTGYLKNVETDFLPVLKRCEPEWNNEWDMVAYCAENQIKAVGELEKIAAGLPENIANEILQSCSNEWGLEKDMVAYCAKNRADAWREIN